MQIGGKTALVTGASRRIGAAIALALAEQGAKLIIHSRAASLEAQALAARVRQEGGIASTSHHDLTKVSGTEKWFRELQEETGPVDILINSASAYETVSYRELTAGQLQRSINLHALSPLMMMRAMAESRRPGSVINLLDTRISDRDPSHAAYHLGKRGLYTLTKDLAAELAPEIRVNGVAPGIILPPPGADSLWLERMAPTNPLERHGSVEDVVEASLFLLRSAFVTGQVLYVDGGRHLKGGIYGS